VKDTAVCSFSQTCKIVDCIVRTMLMWKLTVQVVGSYNDMAGIVALTGNTRGRINAWHVAFTWVNELLTHGSLWASGMVPRGLVLGCHMALIYWSMVWKSLNSTGVEPVTSDPGGETLGRAGIPTRSHYDLLTIVWNLYLKWMGCNIWWSKGWGLAPTPNVLIPYNSSIRPNPFSYICWCTVIAYAPTLRRATTWPCYVTGC